MNTIATVGDFSGAVVKSGTFLSSDRKEGEIIISYRKACNTC